MILRFARLALLLTPLLNALPDLRAADAPPAGPMMGSLPTAKVLFLGNSITLHAPAPNIGWTGNWGMAASAAENDYVHRLSADIARAAGVPPRTMVRNIADFERAYETFDLTAGLKAELEFNADIVIVAIGENVPEPGTDEARAKFAAAFARLLTALQQRGHPAIFVRSSFWPNPAKDDIMRKACAEAGATFVNIAALGRDESNAARSERKIEHAGVAGHPGDQGMGAIAGAILAAIQKRAATTPPFPLIGYTELRTDLPGGRHANVRTMRAMMVNMDGTGRREIGRELIDGPDAWTQFAGWSPDGRQAIVSRGWQDSENARWEEEHRTFRMDEGKWMLDSCLLDLASGKLVNLTAVERVSHYNGGLFFLPDGKGLGFTPLIKGVSKPFLMDLDGRNKRDVSGKDAGFAYGYSASPDGKFISYHEDYQVFIAKADGTEKRKVETGNLFNFGPRWSADGEWLLFVSGMRGKSNPYVVRRDGSGLRRLADLNGYQGWILFLDVPDFHEGSSDVPVWSADGKSVFYTAQVGRNVELFQAALDGRTEQLTRTPDGTLHYHPQPSPDGQWLAYGSKRGGVRQLFAMRLADRSEKRLTDLKAGHGAMWPHWQPGATMKNSSQPEPITIAIRGEAESEMAPHRTGNVYAPEVHRDGHRWLMWYGGQGRDGHDRIHLAESADGTNWTKRGVVLDCGPANHVNDPSVVRVGEVWWMFYTVAETGELDEIAAATSQEGVTWKKHGVVLKRGEGSAWDSWKVGRPSVLLNDGVFRMWFDGQPTKEAVAARTLAATVKREGRAVGYAESLDGLAWQRRSEPVFREGAGAVAVSRDGARLVMVIESHSGTRWATSDDGFAWRSRGKLIPLSGSDADRFGQVTPFLLLHEGRATLYFGAAARKSWDGNAIARANITLP